MESNFKIEIDSYFSSEGGENFIEEKNSIRDVETTEKELNIKIEDAYRYILLNYGGAYLGVDLLPAKKDETIKSDTTIIEYTLSFRKLLSNHRFENKLEGGYVISVEGNGDPIFINKDKKVEIFYHDSEEFEILSQSFEKYILENIS